MSETLEKLKKVLLKKAIGFEKSETLKEYVVDENGNETLTKLKVQKKYFPPDLQALKAYLEMEQEVSLLALSDEELEKEKTRLLSELQEMNKENLEC